MNTAVYESSLQRQAMRSREMLKEIAPLIKAETEQEFSVNEISEAQSVIITGCGDSLMAGIAAQAAFEKLTRLRTRAIRAIEFSRLFRWDKTDHPANKQIVIVISFSGTASRAIECARRANRYGANTIAITGRRNSLLAAECQHTICVNLPSDGEYYPGSLTYTAAIEALFAIALWIAQVKKAILAEDYDRMHAAILHYADKMDDTIHANLQDYLKIADEWKNLGSYDFIGDNSDYATARFWAAKIVETSGGYTTQDDSEGWCHINSLLSNPREIGRVIVANRKTPSFSRLQETAAQVVRLESPLIVITDEPSGFPQEAAIINTPVPEYPWISPILQHMPFDIIAGTIAEINGETAFRNDDKSFDTEEARECVKGGTEIVII